MSPGPGHFAAQKGCVSWAQVFWQVNFASAHGLLLVHQPEEADEIVDLDTSTDARRGICRARDVAITAFLRTGPPARTCPSTGANECAEQCPPAWIRAPTGARPDRPRAPARRGSSTGARPERPRAPTGTGSSAGIGPSAVMPAGRATRARVQNLVTQPPLCPSRWTAAILALGLVLSAPAFATGRTRHSAPPPLHGSTPSAHHTPSPSSHTPPPHTHTAQAHGGHAAPPPHTHNPSTHGVHGPQAHTHGSPPPHSHSRPAHTRPVPIRSHSPLTHQHTPHVSGAHHP